MPAKPKTVMRGTAASHEALVVAQFGPRARAYVESADHAKGADLDRLTAMVVAMPDARVLDLGCGGGHVSFTVAPHVAEVVACDLSHEMLAAVGAVAAERGLTTIRTQQSSAEHLPFAAAYFDLVITRFSAHHWHDVAAGLSEMRRVLKPNGRAIIIDSISPGLGQRDSFLQAIELLRDPSHVRNCTPAEWDAALRAAGFRPGTPVLGKLPLTFAAWTARIGTPDLQVQAILALQRQMPTDVAVHFAIEPDGSFQLDTMMIEADT